MRREFVGYYAPSEAEYERLCREGLIVLDTNVLLDLYRLPASARDDLLAVLELLAERLWVPHQVALEFQRRLSVIASERKATEDALSRARELFDQLSERVGSLQIDKRGLGLESRPLLEGVGEANAKLIEAMDTVHAAQLDIAVGDPIRDRLDVLLEGRVGPAPADQAALDLLVERGEERYDREIPPGFADAGKEKNPREAMFYHDGLAYQRKFGDLVLWRQLIAHARDAGRQVVLLVTSDRKEDWWWKERGKTIGPRPELAREIRREGNAELFWMYSADQFLEHATRFTQAQVSDASVSELKEVARSRPRDGLEFRTRRSLADRSRLRGELSMGFSDAEAAVHGWLTRRFGEVSGPQRAFPDFTIASDNGPHGFEVKVVRSISQMLLPPPVINSMTRGYLEVNEGRLAGLSMILVAEREELASILVDEDGKTTTIQRLRNLLERYPIYEILVGYVDEGGSFAPVIEQRAGAEWEG